MLSANQLPANSSQGGVTLLVEDNDTYRMVVVTALGHYLPGYEIVEAATVDSALAALRSHAIEVVVSDMTLPDGSAIDLIERSRGLIRQGVKFIIFSNHSREDMLPVLDQSGVHSYVEKASGLKALAQAVQAAIHPETHALPASH